MNEVRYLVVWTLVLIILSSLLVGGCDGGQVTANAQSEDSFITDESQAVDQSDEELSLDLSYTIVDTGQTSCYNNTSEIACPDDGEAFYGQDAQYDGNQPSYTISADGLTVYDNVTGLTWTQSPDLDGDGDIDVDDKLTFTEAQAYPDILNEENYGGYSDWRLPSMKQLYSLMNFDGTDPNPTSSNSAGLTPFIDTDYFDFAYGDMASGERIIDAQIWSSDAYTGTVFGDQSAAFGLNLADGRIKGYPTDGGGPVTKLNYVYFVSGDTDYGVNEFADNDDGTVTDSATGLMWSQDDSGSGMDWEDALDWAQQKNDENYLGYDDWRLPDAKEMQSIVDYSRSPDATGSAAIDPVFNVTEITNEAGEADYPWFWTSTTHINDDGSGARSVYICFGRGLGSMDGTNVIDVHGAGCQRSDPKDSDLDDYPSWGNGPQGDVHRVSNYVRLVRDVDTESTDVTVDIYVDLQADNRTDDGWEQEIEVGFYPPESDDSDLMDPESATHHFSGMTSRIETGDGIRARFRCPEPITPGYYDITAHGETSLLNVKRNVGIF